MKPTKALSKKISRLALTTKQTNKGFYKGTGSGSMGDHTKHGGFIINWDKVRTYVPPTKDLKDYKASHPFRHKENLGT
ncbi:60S ribosomal protein L27 [Blumeria hordei DH14]|uniref:60S ribosomal protein L27 n=1 Tax=Blumeria graminis f. sp. hordei (strain DH14) TaxID=546991 RepID=N1J5M1_BLUG1|nr:60S ribosomal protein L27 [Blumeria hordei DH14]